MISRRIYFVLTVLTAMFFASPAFAQVKGGEYMDLFDYYIIGNYEDCLEEAIEYTDDSDTRREPEPYLYAAMVYMQRYEDPDFTGEKDDQLKDALKYAYKFAKYDRDKEGSNLIEQNREILDKLKRLTVEFAEYFYIEEDFRKTEYYLDKYYKVEELPQFQLTVGCNQVLSRNLGQGVRNVEEGLKRLKEEGEIFENKTTLDELTHKSFLQYVDFMVAREEMEDLKKHLELAKTYFVNSREFDDAYNKHVN